MSGCRACPLYATEEVVEERGGRPYITWELLTCGHGRHPWTDTRMCAWWRENCGEPEEGQMRLELR